MNPKEFTYSPSSNNISINLTFLQAVSVLENTDSNSRLEDLRNTPAISRQLNTITPESLVNALSQDARLQGLDLSDHQANLKHFLMSACISVKQQAEGN